MQKTRKFLLKDDNGSYGYIYYLPENNEFKIEFEDGLLSRQPYPPAMVYTAVKYQGRELTGDLAMTWIRERIIPPNRQNIGSILHELGLTEYSEIDMLTAYKGKCCQDYMWIEEVS